MAAIKTQDGRVLLRDGRVSCECCDIQIGEFNFSSPEACDCEAVNCYSVATNPSPQSVVAGGITYTNTTPNTDRFQLGTNVLPSGYSVILQSPNIVSLGGGAFTIDGWNNLVSEPTIVRLFGQVGGDIAIWQRSDLGSPYPENWNSEFGILGEIPQEGQFACGICATPRNGPHQLEAVFVLYPNTYAYINPLSFVECFPWFSLRLRRLGPFTPP